MRRPNSSLRNTAREVEVFRRRSLLAALIVLVLIGVLAGRLVYLQIFEHDVFITRSDNNRIRVEPLPPNRGLIYDREHRILAENRPTYNLTMVREQASEVDQTLKRLIRILDLPDAMYDTLQSRSRQRQRPFEPALLLSDLTEDQIARIAVNRYRLPGVEVEAQLMRYYPDSRIMAHVLGYVGRISQADEKRIDSGNYAGTHYIGKTGIERFYEKALHGTAGVRRVETNARGRILREISRTPPKPGKDLTLTIDKDLQEFGAQLLKGKRGAIVAIDPRNGDILAMVSTPGYDTNQFVNGISSKAYQALQNDTDLPLYNRAVRGQYPPASTVKPYMALDGLETGVMNPSDTIYDPGYYKLPNGDRKYHNWLRWGHGRVDMHRAIVVSNDTYFYHLAHELGIDRIAPFMHKFGFGEDHSLDVWGASDGLMPSREWKRARYNKVWYPGETLSAGIGQGYWLATPLQMATAMTVLANRGHWVRPHLAKKVGDREVEPPFSDTPPDVELKNPDWWHLVIDAMQDVADKTQATGPGREYTMAAKSGTAQVFTLNKNQKYNAEELKEHLRDHALFSAFAPVKNPQIAVAVVVENAGWGSKNAGPVVRKLLDYWLLPRLKQEDRPGLLDQPVQESTQDVHD
ncbi:penicillin-binding protein 2 [Kushneria phosphatilytica]|uniref:Peptidoglycan D,D-transpeptidase MrdA n=1 Tax=Kushneria phosphatilytica TaxID=657387 RepID=A0A5C0ZYY2_9GAMM|nr:penicillin-binding protein 2 [Kushneria phosphatilytica]QEL10917.1 penicillin-binding protein 2 [Kushneria phosphatilytica]